MLLVQFQKFGSGTSYDLKLLHQDSRGKITPCLPLVSIMLETWNLVRKYQHFLAKIEPLLNAIVWELCQKFFSSFFSLSKIKCYYLWKCMYYRTCTWNPASGLLKTGHIGKITMTSQFADMTSLSIFWCCCVSLEKFSYWSKCHVNIIPGSRVSTTFVYKGLTKNEIPVCIFPNIWGLEIPKLAWMSLIKS